MTVYPPNVDVRRGAVIDDTGTYRYRLSRQWAPELYPLPFVMLNPSTADATLDDPTIRKCVGFARRLGFGGIVVRNLYAYRATKPADLWAADRAGVDIVGPDNDDGLRAMLDDAARVEVPVVASWGAHGRQERVDRLLIMPGALRVLHSLGELLAGGQPRHPLMTAYATPLIPWEDW